MSAREVVSYNRGQGSPEACDGPLTLGVESKGGVHMQMGGHGRKAVL
jgi:hypothetical protein